MPPTVDEEWVGWLTGLPLPLKPWQGRGCHWVRVLCSPQAPCLCSIEAKTTKISMLSPPRAAHASPVIHWLLHFLLLHSLHPGPQKPSPGSPPLCWVLPLCLCPGRALPR